MRIGLCAPGCPHWPALGLLMGEFTLNARQKALGWLRTVVMLAAAVGLFATWGK